MPNPLGYLLRHRHAGHDKLVWARPDLRAPESFDLTSTAFAHGEAIPPRYRGRILASNISPPLEWTAPPAASAELVLIVQDPDAPLGTPALHGVTVGIDPALGGIPEGGLSHPSPIPGLRHATGVLGRRGWSGPMPPGSHGPHSYVFQLFALDTSSSLPDGFGIEDAAAAMVGHIVARARLDGTYENR